MTEKEKKMELLYPFSDDTMFRDTDGSRLPWYTPGAIEWIKKNIVPAKSVLEFGGGHSSLWWIKNSIQCFTVEYDEKCCEILGIIKSSPKKFFDEYKGKKYEVVVVDSEAEISRNDYILEAFGACEKYLIVDNWQQPGVCIYSDDVVNFLFKTTREQHIFPYPHNDWQTAIFVL